MGRTPGTNVTIDWPERGSIPIRIGRGLLAECPMEHVEIRRDRGGADPFLVYLRPAAPPIGYKISQSDANARKIAIGRDRAQELGLCPGTYTGWTENGAIVFSLR